MVSLTPFSSAFSPEKSSIIWTASAAQLATRGQVTKAWEANGISIDSRTIKPGNLFVALQGPKFDGHNFVKAAFKAGAAAAVVMRVPEELNTQEHPLLIVPDTLKALSDLGCSARSHLGGTVFAITGSFGKTTTKEMLKAALSKLGETYGNPSSFNNRFGVPFSLSELPPEAQFAILEVGMDHVGEISPLSTMIRPNVAIITTVGEAHIANFSHMGELAMAMGEIFDGLEPGGVAILNHGTPYFELLKETALQAGAGRIISFGQHPEATVPLIEYLEQSDSSQVTTMIKGRLLTYKMPTVGIHWALNSLAVLSAIIAVEGDTQAATETFQQFQLSNGRGEHHLVPFHEGYFTLIDESYNAAPSTMHAAIRNLGNTPVSPQGRRIAVLGDMLELGEAREKRHIDLALHLKLYNIDLVYTSGTYMHLLHNILPPAMRGGHHPEVSPISRLVVQEVRPGDVIMIKGSRGVRSTIGRMHQVVSALLELKR